MPLPGGLQSVTVSFNPAPVLPNGSYRRGKVKFIANPDALLSAGVDIAGTVTVNFDASGTPQAVELLATDAAGVLPSGWTYRVEATWYDAPDRVFDVSLPAASPAVNWADIAPTAPSAGTVPGVSAFGTALVASVDAPAARTTLGLGTAATQPVSAFDAAGAAAAAQAAAVGDIGVFPAATGDGTTNDRAAIAAADAAALAAGKDLVLRPGTYRVATSLDISSPVLLRPGAVIKPDSGATVKLLGGCTAPRKQVFDHSAGGVVAPLKVDFYHPAWWGPLGQADDTATWQAMNAALSASSITFNFAPFTQRILAPTGMNRINGLVLANCELFADRGNVIFAPPVAATSGTMLRINDFVTLRGGYYTTTEAGHAVTLIDHRGFRSQIEGVLVVPAAVNSIGINLGSGASITPVLNDCRIIGGTKAAGSKGVVVNSADSQITNLWVATVGVGIEWLRGVSNVVNMHVWGCGVAGMTGTPDGACWANVFLDSNDGWGADLENLDSANIKNLMVWANGATVPSTGGMRVRQVGGVSCRNTRIEGIIDDNTGTGLLLDGCSDYDLDVKVVSRSVQGGGPAVTDTGVRITSTCARTKATLRGNKTDVVTAVLDDLSTSTAVEFTSIKKVLAADMVWNNSTGFLPVFSVPILAGQRWLLEGMLIVEGHSLADFKARLQATGSTGATGYFGLDNAAGTGATSPTNADMNPITAYAVATGAGFGSISGLIGGGLQMLGFKGYVATGTANGSLDLQAAQQTAHVSDMTIRAGSWIRATRIG